MLMTLSSELKIISGFILLIEPFFFKPQVFFVFPFYMFHHFILQKTIHPQRQFSPHHLDDIVENVKVLLFQVKILYVLLI